MHQTCIGDLRASQTQDGDVANVFQVDQGIVCKIGAADAEIDVFIVRFGRNPKNRSP